MRLPNAQKAHVDREKITDYLLSKTNPNNKGKAEFFFGFGFRLERWQDFAEALCFHGATHDVVKFEETDRDVRYIVDGQIETPDGRNPRIRTVWHVVRGRTSPRLITAYPRRR